MRQGSHEDPPGDKGTGERASSGEATIHPLARLDRIPVWPYNRSLLWIVGAGYFFAFFDIVTIGYAIPVISEQFNISRAAVSTSVTSSLVGYIIGAYADSTIADIWGRRVSLAISVALFTLGTLVAAFSQGLAWLVVWRFVAGLGIGAEIASVTSYMGELSPAPLRGRYTSWATTFAYAGFAVVPIISYWLVPNYSWGWRALFVIGALGGLTILFMRRGLRETPRWLIAHGRLSEAESIVSAAEERARRKLGSELPAPKPEPEEVGTEGFPTLALLRPPYLWRVILFIAIWFVYYVGNYGWLTLAPSLLVSQGYSLAESISFLIVTGIGFFGGAIATTFFSDRIERKFSTLAIAVIWGIVLFIIGFFPSPPVIIVGGFVASTTIGLLVPMLYTLTAEHFSTRSRATGVALTDGLGHIGGAAAPFFVLTLGAQVIGGFSGAFVVMGISGLVTAALLTLATRATGRSLESAAR
jgi:MFS transporter, putative metabolite:H+ symporter